MDGGASHYADATGVYLGNATYTEDGKEVEQLPEEFFSTTFYTDRLIEYIDADRGSGRPFFAYLGYTAPHWPLQAPDEWLERTRGRYDSPSIPAWDELSDLAKRVEARRMEVYAAMVENLDHHIGRLLEYLETIGEAAWQLYDLSTDPAETIDLAEAYPERLQAMIAEWHAYAAETGVLPLDRDVSGFRSWQLVHE